MPFDNEGEGEGGDSGREEWHARMERATGLISHIGEKASDNRPMILLAALAAVTASLKRAVSAAPDLGAAEAEEAIRLGRTYGEEHLRVVLTDTAPPEPERMTEAKAKQIIEARKDMSVDESVAAFQRAIDSALHGVQLHADANAVLAYSALHAATTFFRGILEQNNITADELDAAEKTGVAYIAKHTTAVVIKAAP